MEDVLKLFLYIILVFCVIIAIYAAFMIIKIIKNMVKNGKEQSDKTSYADDGKRDGDNTQGSS